MQTAIEEKDQQISELKSKLEAHKAKQEEAEKSINKSAVTSPPAGNRYSLVKIADEINEIKQLVSGKKAVPENELDKEIEFEDFAPMEKLESEYIRGGNIDREEDSKIVEKINEWKRMKAEVAAEKKEIQNEQEAIEKDKEKWKENLAYLKTNYTEDVEERKKVLLDEKAEIDKRIKEVNARIEANKDAAQKVKQMEVELKPYLEKEEKGGKKKEGLRRLLDFEQKPVVQTGTNFYRPEFEELESFGFSSEHDS